MDFIKILVILIAFLLVKYFQPDDNNSVTFVLIGVFLLTTFIDSFQSASKERKLKENIGTLICEIIGYQKGIEVWAKIEKQLK